MFGLISGVRRNSLAEAAGIAAGEKLCSVNGIEVKDIIELSFQAADDQVELEIEGLDGLRRKVIVDKYLDEDLGLEFSSAVFDKVNECYNKCLFCFVEQMIPGMRPGLYVRDDDFRLSFLYGNFITLTNMKDADFERIIATHMTPLYVSVHATDPATRCRMMNNRFAGQLMDKLKRLLDAGIQVHTQIVCCPGYNDGAILEKSFKELYALHPGVLTMAVVPVGLTKNRAELTPLRTFTKEEAADIVDFATRCQRKCRRETGKSFIYLGDEFYLLAEKELPKADWYDGFPQLENGIGLTRNFLEEWNKELKSYRKTAKPKTAAIIPVGESAARVLTPLINRLNSIYKTEHKILAVPNLFFGGAVNVTGLLTGGDILHHVQEAKRVVLPAVVLNKDQLFLDDMSFAEFKEKCQGRVETAVGAKELLEKLLEK